MSVMTFKDQLKHARRAGVPLIWISTPDPQALVRGVNGAFAEAPAVQWDIVAGVRPVNEGGKTVAQKFTDESFSPPGFLVEAVRMPPGTVAYMHGADMLTVRDGKPDPMVTQGIANLRDQFKADGRLLILLGHTAELPPQLKDDVVVLDEPYPDAEQLGEIIDELDAAARVCGKCDGQGVKSGLKCGSCGGTGQSKRKKLTKAERAGAVEATTGLSAFAAEQAVAMALRPKGIDLDHLWATNRAVIEQTRGLSVYRGGERFADLGGLEPIKEYGRRIIAGRRPVRLLVWLDEVEKTGLAARQDTSGVNQDQEGQLLTWMEDHDVYGVMLLGVPGAGKSAYCKACAAEFDRTVIRLDLGAMQGSLVGESQQALRTALKVIEAVGGNETVWMATSNSVDGLSAAMRSRFVDTFFFDLPGPDELKAIWQVWLSRYPDVIGSLPDGADDGWVGRNVRRCVEKAWTMQISLKEAAKYIIPVARIEAEEIERLRRQADGRYLSAQEPGVYRQPMQRTGRAVAV